MIEYIKGTLTHIDAQYVVVEAHGVGYQIYCGNPFHFQSSVQTEVTVYTYQYVREDTVALYGFSSREERTLFIKLLNVSGVGPKGALSIIATGKPKHLVTAIQTEDLTFLTKFPGIGKKTAQRIILDLKDKLDDLSVQLLHADPSGDLDSYFKTDKGGVDASERIEELQEALEALKALGYSDREVQQIKKDLKAKAEDSWSTDQYVKAGLQLLLK